MSENKPILCLNFDGVIHGYDSGWVEPDFLPDPPVRDAMLFLFEAIQHFDVKIFSSRSQYLEGIRAMRVYIRYWAKKELPREQANTVINAISNNADAWPKNKPAAMITIDDRAITFTGAWPSIKELKDFKPWNKK